MLAKARAGRDALLVADTGAGKTLAGFLPTLCDFAPSGWAVPADGLHTLYVSPLKALAEKHGATIEITPASLGGMHKLTGNAPPMIPTRM